MQNNEYFIEVAISTLEAVFKFIEIQEVELTKLGIDFDYDIYAVVDSSDEWSIRYYIKYKEDGKK
tara:strand:- start:761 stop:955 length:195 start_codon:yes stop_codon:yes gene_type:complete